MDTFNEKYLKGTHLIFCCILVFLLNIIFVTYDIRKLMLPIFNQELNKFWQHGEK